MKKAIVRIKGGLGNQLFMYAFSKAYSLRTNSKLIIDDVSGFGKHDIYKSSFVLDQIFREDDRVSGNFLLKHIIGSRYFWGILRRAKIYLKEFYISEQSNDYCNRSWQEYKSKSPFCFIEGYWHSACYFKEYSNELRDTFKECKSSLNLNSQFINNVENSVGVGLRYFQEVSDAPQHHTMIDKEYYRKAVNFICEKLDKPHFFIFSNDKDKAAEFFDFDVRKTIIEPSSNDVLDLLLMSCCQHFVISNSSYHWWGAWIGENESSITVAPEAGIRNRDMIPSHWYKL